MKEPAMTSTMTTKQASSGNGGIIQLVNFLVDNEEYGVEVLKVREIIRMTDVTRVPNAPAFVDGVFNLRGKVIPIISLRKRLSLPLVEYDSNTRIIVIDLDNDLTGIIVDAVAEVIRITAEDIQPAPEGATHDSIGGMFSGLVNRANRLLVLLDLDVLLNSDKIKSSDGIH
jgi:purine-binding chemotaxis protein CheW